jgi:hypothetical protein
MPWFTHHEVIDSSHVPAWVVDGRRWSSFRDEQAIDRAAVIIGQHDGFWVLDLCAQVRSVNISSISSGPMKPWLTVGVLPALGFS